MLRSATSVLPGSASKSAELLASPQSTLRRNFLVYLEWPGQEDRAVTARSATSLHRCLNSLLSRQAFPVPNHAISGMKPQISAADRLREAQYTPSEIDDFPVNRSKTGSLAAERGSLRTAPRTNQSNSDTGFRLWASPAALVGTNS